MIIDTLGVWWCGVTETGLRLRCALRGGLPKTVRSRIPGSGFSRIPGHSWASKVIRPGAARRARPCTRARDPGGEMICHTHQTIMNSFERISWRGPPPPSTLPTACQRGIPRLFLALFSSSSGPGGSVISETNHGPAPK